jgi:TusA-related sulfurtransferase
LTNQLGTKKNIPEFLKGFTVERLKEKEEKLKRLG